MSQKHGKTELEKEFELERVVLFSDAVFAIAITLLVIDIKFPGLPAAMTLKSLSKLFRPTIYQFLGFAISFWFIGNSWSKHLRLFRLLKKYDQGLVTRNLIYLFFIVIFPFTASGFASATESGVEENSQTGILFAIFLYTFNIACVSICHFIICRYIFHQRPGLTIDNEAAEKKFLYIESKFTCLMIVTAVLLCFGVTMAFPGREEYVAYSFFVLPAMALYLQWKKRKYLPRKTD